jgi:hypothetical protein
MEATPYDLPAYRRQAIYDSRLERMYCSVAVHKTKDEGQRSKVGWQNSWKNRRYFEKA